MEKLRKWNIEQFLKTKNPGQNYALFWVDDTTAFRIVKIRGEFPSHKHPCDEAWFVYRGKITLRSNNEDFTLEAGESICIPKGMVHSPYADIEDSIVIIISGKMGTQHIFKDGHQVDRSIERGNKKIMEKLGGFFVDDISKLKSD